MKDKFCLDLTLEDLTAWCESRGVPKYRASQIYGWLSSGAVPTPKAEIPAPSPAPAEPDEQLQKAIGLVDALIKEKLKNAELKPQVIELVVSIIGDKNYKKCADINKLRELYSKLKDI